MKKSIVYLFLSVFLFACNSDSKDVKPNVEKAGAEDSSFSVENNKFNTVLQEEVANYIKEVDNKFIDKEWLYYNLYFFKKDSVKYFTIWTSTTYPSYISPCVDTGNCAFYLFNFNNRKLVIIDDKANTNFLFTSSEDNVLLAKKEDLKNYAGDIYDGSLYFRTYQIEKNSYGVSLIKLDTAISDFINCEKLVIDDDLEF